MAGRNRALSPAPEPWELPGTAWDLDILEGGLAPAAYFSPPSMVFGFRKMRAAIPGQVTFQSLNCPPFLTSSAFCCLWPTGGDHTRRTPLLHQPEVLHQASGLVARQSGHGAQEPDIGGEVRRLRAATLDEDLGALDANWFFVPFWSARMPSTEQVIEHGAMHHEAILAIREVPKAEEAPPA